MIENSELLRLHGILEERQKTLKRVGSGEVKAHRDLESAEKVGRVRSKLTEKIESLKGKIDYGQVKSRYERVETLYQQGYLTEEEIVPHRELVKILGIEEEGRTEELISRFGLKGNNLELIKILAGSSRERPLTSRELAVLFNQRMGTQRNKTYITSIFVKIRPKLIENGYQIYDVPTDKPGSHAYYLDELSEHD